MILLIRFSSLSRDHGRILRDSDGQNFEPGVIWILKSGGISILY
jgi:hypothetical protein